MFSIKLALSLGIALYGRCIGIAQESQAPDAIVVKIADIHRQDFNFEPYRVGDTICLSFAFEHKDKADVDALFNEAVVAKRPVHILDGTNVVATCTIVGRLMLDSVTGRTYYGLALGFASMAEANLAAISMQEPVEDTIRRRNNDRSHWML